MTENYTTNKLADLVHLRLIDCIIFFFGDGSIHHMTIHCKNLKKSAELVSILKVYFFGVLLEIWS